MYSERGRYVINMYIFSYFPKRKEKSGTCIMYSVEVHMNRKIFLTEEDAVLIRIAGILGGGGGVGVKFSWML